MKLRETSFNLCFATLLVVLAGCSESPPSAQEASAPMDSLVSAEWLMARVGDPDLVVLDATVLVQSDAAANMEIVNGRASYEEGHIPGAGFAELMGELSAADAEFDFTLPSPQAFADAMGALGVGDETRVVLYDRMGMPWAGRVWWMLRWIGFDNAALLDGGLDAWTAAGGALSTEPVTRSPRTLSVKLRPELIANQDEVRASIEDDAIRLIDVLPEIHYRGEWTMYEQPGHIPGAINVPTSTLFDESGHFHEDEKLAELFGDDADARTITYCGGGIAASLDAFVMTRLGFTDAAIYDGSLEEWTATPDNPMDIDLEGFGGAGE